MTAPTDRHESERSAPEPGADRAIDDPVKLQRAARIVRAALERQGLTLDDLVPADSSTDSTTRRAA